MLGQKAKDEGIEHTRLLPHGGVTGMWDKGELGARYLAGNNLRIPARL
jgi:hypothetical protein